MDHISVIKEKTLSTVADVPGKEKIYATIFSNQLLEECSIATLFSSHVWIFSAVTFSQKGKLVEQFSIARFHVKTLLRCNEFGGGFNIHSHIFNGDADIFFIFNPNYLHTWSRRKSNQIFANGSLKKFFNNTGLLLSFRKYSFNPSKFRKIASTADSRPRKRVLE